MRFIGEVLSADHGWKVRRSITASTDSRSMAKVAAFSTERALVFVSSLAPAVIQALTLAISVAVGWAGSFLGGIFFLPVPSMAVRTELDAGLLATTPFLSR